MQNNISDALDEVSMKVGLAVIRLQPIHKGHVRLINRMLMDCDMIIIGLGSAQESRTERNPFTPVERMEMIHRVFGQSSKIKIIPIEDKKTSMLVHGVLIVTQEDRKVWTDHVFETISHNPPLPSSSWKPLPVPTDYYGGCEADIDWYRDTHMNLHIIDRECIITTQATNVRMDIAAGGTMWKDLVPEVVVPMIEFYYPAELKNFKQISVKIQWESRSTTIKA